MDMCASYVYIYMKGWCNAAISQCPRPLPDSALPCLRLARNSLSLFIKAASWIHSMMSSIVRRSHTVREEVHVCSSSAPQACSHGERDTGPRASIRRRCTCSDAPYTSSWVAVAVRTQGLCQQPSRLIDMRAHRWSCNPPPPFPGGGKSRMAGISACSPDRTPEADGVRADDEHCDAGTRYVAQFCAVHNTARSQSRPWKPWFRLPRFLQIEDGWNSCIKWLCVVIPVLWNTFWFWSGGKIVL